MSYEYVAQIREVLDSPRPLHQLGAKHWHQAAPQVLVDPGKNFPREICEVGMDILQTFPYDHLEACLATINDEPGAFAEERFLRKTLMVGRDALNLANRTDLCDNPDTKPLRALIGYMGRVADTKARKPKLLARTARLIEPARESVFQLESSFVQPRKPKQLLQLAQLQLQTPLLTTAEGKWCDEETYHAARRAFRSVVHLGVVSCLQRPSDAKLAIVTEGTDLNTKYGNRHKKLLNNNRMAQAYSA